MKCSNCSIVVKPVVSIDIDGTIGDYYGHFVHFANGYFGGHPLDEFPNNWDGLGEWEEYLGLTKQSYRECKLAYRQGGMKRTMPLFPGGRELIVEAKEAGAEIWLTTTRPWMRLDSVDPDTREWLRRHEIPYDHLLYDDHKYARLAELVHESRVVFVLDDLRAECQNAQDVFCCDNMVYQHKIYHNRNNQFERRISLQEARKIVPKMIADWEPHDG